MNWSAIIKHIENASGLPFSLKKAYPLAGGDINHAFRLEGAERNYFIKLNRADKVDMFAAEESGLTEMAATRTVKVPLPLTYGQTSEHAFLVLEYIEFGSNQKNSRALLGEQLALLHLQRQPYFGWHRDNTIGSTPQPNPRHVEWLPFLRTQRFQHQLHLAAGRGYRGHLQTMGLQLCDRLAGFFDGYSPHPSLLHGDLWGGNAAADTQGNPVIFDPACYYGDREADLAMTELFGGFGADFYAAYRNAYPVDRGYSVRKTLYNLYHILNHLNLFGSAYLGQAETMMSRLLSDVK